MVIGGMLVPGWTQAAIAAHYPYGYRRGFDDMDRDLCLSMAILVKPLKVGTLLGKRMAFD